MKACRSEKSGFCNIGNIGNVGNICHIGNKPMLQPLARVSATPPTPFLAETNQCYDVTDVTEIPCTRPRIRAREDL